MNIQGNGITLHRLKEDEIETIRYWRNHPKIQKYMDYRKCITAEQQKRWFASINNAHNYYFVVELGGKDVGLVDIKNIDYQPLENGGGTVSLVFFFGTTISSARIYRTAHC